MLISRTHEYSHKTGGRPSRICLAASRRVSLLCGWLLAIFWISPAAVRAAEIQRDVVVYGATAAGAMAGIAAARHGASVLILEPGRHVGGMVSGGLSRSDVLNQEHLIGGLTLELYERIGKHYGRPVSFQSEPHVAEDAFNAMLKEAGVQVRFSQSLDDVDAKAGSLRSLRTRDGSLFTAKVFIDATYEGDLMKAAGVSYTVGREGRDRYGESLAGRCELIPMHHQFRAAVSPWLDGKLLPYITPQEKLAPVGAGDGKIQAYCFRLCLTNRPENRLPIPRPDEYDPARYELLRRYIEALVKNDDGAVHRLLGIGLIPNGKCDVNSGGAVSSNLLGANQEYPEATPERRAEIREEHRSWVHGFLYYLQNDPSVPEKVRATYSPWGLCRDEFQDTGGWPHQIYVREARRMLGECVLTQQDLQKHRRKHDVVGMAGYNIDIREVQWVSVRNYHFPRSGDETLLEGYLSEPVEPWDIPYRSLLPKFSECSNLLVPVCMSASTVAYASFRMEPNYMIAGHAAGAAAALAAKASVSVHCVNLNDLQNQLRADGQILAVDKK